MIIPIEPRSTSRSTLDRILDIYGSINNREVNLRNLLTSSFNSSSSPKAAKISHRIIIDSIKLHSVDRWIGQQAKQPTTTSHHRASFAGCAYISCNLSSPHQLLLSDTLHSTTHYIMQFCKCNIVVNAALIDWLLSYLIVSLHTSSIRCAHQRQVYHVKLFLIVTPLTDLWTESETLNLKTSSFDK